MNERQNNTTDANDFNSKNNYIYSAIKKNIHSRVSMRN